MNVLDEPSADATQERLVRGYFDALDGKSPRDDSAAYKHGYKNGTADRTNTPYEHADVLRRRAEMILSVEEISNGQ